MKLVTGQVESKVESKIVRVTPQIALDWLTRNTSNRPIRKGHVKELADRMKRGEWHMNGEPIKFSAKDVLLDGQHRLEAILESEVPCELMVVYGLPEEAYQTLDTGMKRTNSDYFAVKKEVHYKYLASALRYLHYLLAGRGDFGSSKVSNSMLDNVLATHPNIRNSLEPGLRVKLMPFGVAIALHYLFSSVNDVKADEFFDSLATGVDLEAGSPVLQLRERLVEKPKGYTIRPVMAAALTIKSWNAYSHGVTLPNLRWRRSGDAPEAFPSITRPPVVQTIIRKAKGGR